MHSFSQEWGVALRNEEAVQEVTRHTAQDLKIWWGGRGRLCLLTLPKAGGWGWGPCSSSPSYFCHLLVSSLASPTSSVTKPYCGFFEMMIMILSCYFDDYTALLLCYPNNLLFPVSGSKDPEVGGARGSLCMLPLEILKPGRTVIHRQTIG